MEFRKYLSLLHFMAETIGRSKEAVPELKQQLFESYYAICDRAYDETRCINFKVCRKLVEHLPELIRIGDPIVIKKRSMSLFMNRSLTEAELNVFVPEVKEDRVTFEDINKDSGEIIFAGGIVQVKSSAIKNSQYEWQELEIQQKGYIRVSINFNGVNTEPTDEEVANLANTIRDLYRVIL